MGWFCTLSRNCSSMIHTAHHLFIIIIYSTVKAFQRFTYICIDESSNSRRQLTCYHCTDLSLWDKISPADLLCIVQMLFSWFTIKFWYFFSPFFSDHWDPVGCTIGEGWDLFQFLLLWIWIMREISNLSSTSNYYKINTLLVTIKSVFQIITIVVYYRGRGVGGRWIKYYSNISWFNHASWGKLLFITCHPHLKLHYIQ